jgi:hypothetical protein
MRDFKPAHGPQHSSFQVRAARLGAKSSRARRPLFFFACTRAHTIFNNEIDMYLLPMMDVRLHCWRIVRAACAVACASAASLVHTCSCRAADVYWPAKRCSPLPGATAHGAAAATVLDTGGAGCCCDAGRREQSRCIACATAATTARTHARRHCTLCRSADDEPQEPEQQPRQRRQRQRPHVRQ